MVDNNFHEKKKKKLTSAKQMVLFSRSEVCGIVSHSVCLHLQPDAAIPYASTFLNNSVFVGFGLIVLPTSICAYLSVTPSGILIS